IVAADAEFGKTACDGTRANAKAGGVEVVYDKSYPPSTADYAPVLPAVHAANPHLGYVCAYPPDPVGLIRAAHQVDFAPKMWGGLMIGVFATAIKMELGPMMNGLVVVESFVPSPKLNFPGLKEVLAKYQAKAPELKIDPLGHAYVPFGYAAGQVLAQAVEGTKSLDAGKIADYIHANEFKTVLGDIRFRQDGEWAKSRQFITQYQGLSGNDINQFRDTGHQVILWPTEYKTGNIIYPYDKARNKQ